MGKMILIMAVMATLGVVSSCGGTRSSASADSASAADPAAEGYITEKAFDADSAYSYVHKQVAFGPRVPNSEAHEQTRAWLAAELRRHGAEVTEQQTDLKAFDGTVLKTTNIIGRFNPDKGDRLLLLAHYDTRPWADKDPDPANHSKPIDGANDGASGVGVLLEIARQIKAQNIQRGIDILFCDSEDYGAEDNEDSWALGAQYFAQQAVKEGYQPIGAILLDMVGGKEAVFPAEYFSRQAAPTLDDAVRAAAERAGYGHLFPKRMGGAVTDDHVQLIENGIPAIDIIDYREDGFCPTWHTLSDNMDNIDINTLRAVGETLWQVVRN